jgi:hypothetical protein
MHRAFRAAAAPDGLPGRSKSAFRKRPSFLMSLERAARVRGVKSTLFRSFYISSFFIDRTVNITGQRQK